MATGSILIVGEYEWQGLMAYLSNDFYAYIDKQLVCIGILRHLQDHNNLTFSITYIDVFKFSGGK